MQDGDLPAGVDSLALDLGQRAGDGGAGVLRGERRGGPRRVRPAPVISRHGTSRGGPLDSTKTIVYFLWEKAFKSLQFGYGSAVAYLLFAFTLVITVGVILYARRARIEAF